jgi:hypothetical protein
VETPPVCIVNVGAYAFVFSSKPLDSTTCLQY